MNKRKEGAQEDALKVLERLVSQFPGLLTDDDVNGCDLVDAIDYELSQSDDLNVYLSVFTIDCETGK